MRLAGIAGFALATIWLLDWCQTEVGDSARMTALVVILTVYAVLLAVPFVPGVEIGLTLLMVRGAEMAPFVWLATFLGLSLAFLVGSRTPAAWIEATVRDLGLRRLADQVRRNSGRSSDALLQDLCDRLPGWLAPIVCDYRYVTFAVLLNVPGNAIVGGGGGLALMAGLSRLFKGPAMMLTIALAVTPVPLAVWFFGPNLLPWTQ